MPDADQTRGEQRPAISLIVVAYDMARELPRTLHTLSRAYQRDIEELDYEVIVVDNGSPEPVPAGMVHGCGPEFRLLRIDDASPSPAAAVNRGASIARGEQLGLIVDGARMVTPGVLHWARRATFLRPQAVVAVVGFHLGPDLQRHAARYGYNQQVEDALLLQLNWRLDGYRLFQASTLAGSAVAGWSGPLAESNCLFVPATLFHQLGGFEERFSSPGGGLVNLDFYRRACQAPDTELFCLAGEGSFHQIHGGITTGGDDGPASRFEDMRAEYQAIRGEPFEITRRRATLLGRVGPETAAVMSAGAGHTAASLDLEARRRQLFESVGLTLPAD
jgi:hypothetical protein